MSDYFFELDDSNIEHVIATSKEDKGQDVIYNFLVTPENTAWMSEAAVTIGDSEDVKPYHFEFTITGNPADLEAEYGTATFLKYLEYKGFPTKLPDLPRIAVEPIETTTTIPVLEKANLGGKVRGFEPVLPKFRKNKTEPTLPTRGSKHSAGYDIHSPVSFILEPGHKTKFATDLKAYMQGDEYLLVLPRSSVGTKGVMITNTAGVIDSDYYSNEDNDGNIHIFLYNFGDDDFVVEAGDRIAQAIFTKYHLVDGDDVETERFGGHGHTGK